MHMRHGTTSLTDGAPWTTRALAAAVSAALLLPPGAPLLAQTGTPVTPASKGDDSVQLNFVNSDLEAAVRAVGQITGRNFVIDPRVKGTLTLVTERPVSRQQAYEQLLAALRLQGFTIVESGTPGGVSRIVPEADAKLQGGRVVAPAAAAPRGDQIVTQVFRLNYENATTLVPVLRPLIAPNNTISANPGNNSLVITDYADNLRRLQRIIEALDSPTAADVEIVPLKHGLAVEMASIIGRMLDDSARGGQAVDAGQRVTLSAEPRTNTLVLRTASPARRQLAKTLIERLDQPSATPGNINVIYLRNAEAVKLAPTLRAIISSDPSFLPQTTSAGLSTTGPGGTQTGAPGIGGIPGQPGQPAITQQQQTTFGTGTTGGAGGAGGALSGLIQADAATNSLIITAPEPLYRNLRTIIEKLDTRRAQVNIETLIVEINADKAAELGVQWQALEGLNSDGTRAIGGTNFGGPGTNILSVAQDLTSVGPGLNLGVIKGTINIPGIGEITNLGFLARALQTVANANVRSQPNIQVLDNEEAKFLVGQNVPFVTGSFTQTGVGATNPFQTFERKDIGTQLRIKPQVSEGGVVKLTVYVEVSSLQAGTINGQPITNKRSFESSLVVEDGNFVVLSGLIEDRGGDSISKVPMLGDIPVLGYLFRYENRTRSKVNTMVFLKPNVIRDEKASSALAADRYDYMRTQLIEGIAPDNAVFRGFQPEPIPSGAPTRNVPQPGATGAPPSSGPASGTFAASQSSTAPAGRVQLIQVTTLPDVTAARDTQRRLREAGFDAYWESVPTAQGDSVRIRVAVDTARASVDSTIAELRKLGYNPVPVAQ